MPDSLYDRDFYAWTQQQAAALRAVAALRVNLPDLDLEKLAEEIEDVGNDTLSKIEGLVARVVEHLLKLEHAPDDGPRRHWMGEVTVWRVTVARRARRSPTALDRLDLDELTRDAVRILRAANDDAWTAGLSSTCPYTLAQVLDTDWWPERRGAAPEA